MSPGSTVTPARSDGRVEIRLADRVARREDLVAEGARDVEEDRPADDAR